MKVYNNINALDLNVLGKSRMKCVQDVTTLFQYSNKIFKLLAQFTVSS